MGATEESDWTNRLPDNAVSLAGLSRGSGEAGREELPRTRMTQRLRKDWDGATGEPDRTRSDSRGRLSSFDQVERGQCRS